MLIPLRGFLGVTFLYAGLQKLANPAYLRASDPASVVGQMQALRHTSPLGPLLGLSLHAPTFVGVTIAFGEIAVAVGVLLGLWTRLAACGGMALSLTFFLTVSWSTTPYYYGSDIVFFFAWSVIALFGSAGVLSLDALFHSRARQLCGLSPAAPAYPVAGERLRESCSHGAQCGLDPATGCRKTVNCPFFGPAARERSAATDVDRRRLVLASRSAVVLGLGVLGVGGVTAVLGRIAGGRSSPRHGADLAGPAATTTPRAATGAARIRRQPARRARAGSAGPVAPGVAIGSTSQVPVGEAGRFTDPGSGEPAYVVHPSGNTFVAFSAVCTHAGCTVGFDPANLQFVCPCHGGRYDARTGQVVAGPPPSPLPSIAVHIVNGTIRVD
jgi:thiosulfate dehydrogenase [quinone] large subunit